MKISEISLPHPVLGIRDDIKGDFIVDPKILIDIEEIRMSIDYKLEENTLSDLIKANKASFLTEVSCASTIFRKSYKSKNKKAEIIISAEYLREKVEINFFIVANETMDDYRPIGINPDYGNNKFLISNGDILAYGGSGSFIIEKDWRRLKKLSSFIFIDKGDFKKGPAEYDLSGDRILIKLSEEDYVRTKNFQGVPNVANLFHSGIIYPALLYAISNIYHDRDSFIGVCNWADYIDNMISNDLELKDLDQDNPESWPCMAQQILKNPLDRTLSSIELMIESMSEEESE